MKLFDALAWTGAWPFSPVAVHEARSLAAELAANGISGALVSPFEAVFAPDPAPANRRLLHDTRATSGLVPVPVVNPALPGWERELEACRADARVRIVRLLPAYHGYRLDGRAAAAFARVAAADGLAVAVQMRLVDERHEHHAVRVRPVPVAALESFARRTPELRLLASGLLRSEIKAVAPRLSGVRFDTAFAEWLDTVPDLLARARPEQLVFATNAPLLIPAAGRAKVATASVPDSVRAAIGGGNLPRLLAGTGS
jgi:predicted TIM-barrel fold metal-dependent hydrolase